MLRLKVFFPGSVLGTSAGRFSTTMKTLPVKSHELGLKNATGLRNGAVEALVSDGLDHVRVSKWEVPM